MKNARSQEILQRILIFLGVVFYLFVFPHGIHGDGFVRYQGLQTLLEEGKVSPMIYSYVGPLFSLPLYFLGHWVKDEFWWVSRFNSFVFLATVFFLWRGFRDHLGREGGRVFILLLFCGSFFPRHTADFYSEVFSACLTGLGILWLMQEKWRRGSLALLLAAWNTPATALGTAALFLYFAAKNARYRYLLILPLIGSEIVAENWLKFGEWLPGAYVNFQGEGNYLPYSRVPGFGYPLFFGLLSTFFSFGKGLLFFCPGILAAFFRNTFLGLPGEFLRAGLFYIAGLLLVYPRWSNWSGDWYWGPRYYLFVSLWAALALAKISLEGRGGGRRRLFWVFATGLSLWAGLEGISFGNDFLEECSGPMGFICHYVPEYSALWRLFVAEPHWIGRKTAFLVYFSLVAAALLAGPLRILLAQGVRSLAVKVREIRGRSWRL